MKKSLKIQEKVIPKNINNYKVEHKLFEINSNPFYVGINTYINEKVLIRIFPKNNLNNKLEEISHINNEIYLLKLLNHKNILRLYEIIESKDYIFLIYEYFDCELLSNFIKNKKLNEKQIFRIVHGIIVALIYTHNTMKISHLTLNLNSILIDKEFNIKIINFKYGCIYSKNIDKYINNEDMSLYNCPEIHAKQQFNPELADVYSCGVITYYLYTGELPFKSKTKIVIDELIMKGEYYLPKNTSEKMMKVITTLMENDPTKRKKFKQILNENLFSDLKTDDKKEIRGLNVLHERYPIDDNVMKICNEYQMNKKDLFKYLNNNNFNNLTSLYKQIENKLNKKGIKTLGDLTSDKFIGYLNNNMNHYENKNIHEKLQKGQKKVHEDLEQKITIFEKNQLNIYEELKELKNKYNNGEYKKTKKEIDTKRLSSRRKSQMYGQQLLNNLSKKKDEYNIKKVNNNEPNSFMKIKEVNVGYSMNEKNDKDKNKKYKKCSSQKIDEEKENNKGILKNFKKTRNRNIRRGSSLAISTSSINEIVENKRKNSLTKNISNFDEFLVSFYEKEEKEKQKKLKNEKSKKKEDNNNDNKSLKPNKSLRSSKSKKSMNSSRSNTGKKKVNKIENEKTIKKEYIKMNSIKKEKEVIDLKNKIKKNNSTETNKEENIKDIKNKNDTKNLSENKNENKVVKINEPKNNHTNNNIVKSKSRINLKEKDVIIKEENNNEKLNNTKKNIMQNTNIKNNSIQNLKVIKDKENEKKIEKKIEKKEKIPYKKEEEKKIEVKESKKIEPINIKDIKKDNNNNKEINKSKNKEKKESKTPNNNHKIKNDSETKGKEVKKEPKNLEKTTNKKEIKEVKENKKEKENLNGITKNYNDLFLNLTTNKKNDYENKIINNTNPNKAQSSWTLKNLNLREDMLNYNQYTNIETKPSLKFKKIKDKKVKIKKFNEKENKNNILYKSRKKNNKKNEIEDIQLDEYKKYLNALFNENSQNNYTNSKNNNISPSNNNSLLKKNKSNYYYNYTMDNIKESNNSEENNIYRNVKKSNGKKKKKKNNNMSGNYINNHLNTFSSSNSPLKKEKKHINFKKNGTKTKNNNLIVDNQDNQESNDSYDKILNEYFNIMNMNVNNVNNVNNSSEMKKNNNHKRIKSNFEQPGYTNTKQNIEEKNNSQKDFYKGGNRSVNLLNKLNKNKSNKLKITSNEKQNKNKINNKSKIYLSINNLKNKESLNNYSTNTNTNIKNKNSKNNKINNTHNNNRNTNSYLSELSFITNSNLSLEELKNRLKDKLISVTHELQTVLNSYHGPINISCISLKNVEESMNDILYKMKMKGYNCSRNKENLLKCYKGDKAFDIEIVKIKGNLLYYLIKK